MPRKGYGGPELQTALFRLWLASLKKVPDGQDHARDLVLLHAHALFHPLFPCSTIPRTTALPSTGAIINEEAPAPDMER